LLVVEVRRFIPEKSETLANASAIMLLSAKTALFTVIIGLEYSLRKFTP